MRPFLAGFCSELTKVASLNGVGAAIVNGSDLMAKISEASGDSSYLASMKGPKTMGDYTQRKQPDIYRPSPKFVAKPEAPKPVVAAKPKGGGGGGKTKPGRMPWADMRSPASRKAGEVAVDATNKVRDEVSEGTSKVLPGVKANNDPKIGTRAVYSGYSNYGGKKPDATPPPTAKQQHLKTLEPGYDATDKKNQFAQPVDLQMPKWKSKAPKAPGA